MKSFQARHNKRHQGKGSFIRDRVKIAQFGQKCNADSKRREVTYEVGDRVMWGDPLGVAQSSRIHEICGGERG
jgi:hypothetical protein